MTAANLADMGKFRKKERDEDFVEQVSIPKPIKMIKFNGLSLLNNPEGFTEKNMRLNKKGMFGDCNMDNVCGV